MVAADGGRSAGKKRGLESEAAPKAALGPTVDAAPQAAFRPTSAAQSRAASGAVSAREAGGHTRRPSAAG
eukprot:1830348-Rhodomonas_salina.1